MSEKTKNDITPKHTVTAGRAGVASEDLFDGQLIVVHDNLCSESSALPLPIKHVYNNKMCDGMGDLKVPKSHCGKDWRLNIQQYIIYDKETKTYRHIDGAGLETDYKATYYYENSIKEKMEIIGDDINDIFTDVESKLHYAVGGRVEEVIIEYNHDGYSLVNKLTGIKGCDNLEQRTDEVIELKEKIKYIDDELERLEEIVMQKEAYKHSLYAEKSGLQYSWDATDKTFATVDAVAHPRSFNGELKFPIPINELDGCIQPPPEVYPRAIFNTICSHSYNMYKIHSDSYAYVNINKRIADIESDYKRHEEDITAYKKQKINLEHELIKLLFTIPSCYIMDREKNIYAFAKADVSFSTSADIDTAVNDKSCVYKLIGISDKYENAISINYDIDIAAISTNDINIDYSYTTGKLSSVTDDKGNTIVIEYKDDATHKIIDNKGRVTEFSLQSGMLDSIKYNDGMISNYIYKSSMLSQMTCDGYGVRFEYALGKVTSVNELSNVVEITNDSIIRLSGIDEYAIGDSINIEYMNDHSTVFIDNQGGRATYVFDEDGKVLYLYDGKYTDTQIINSSKIVAYEYDGDNQSLAARSLITHQSY